MDQEVLLRRYSQTKLPESGSLCWGDCFFVLSWGGIHTDATSWISWKFVLRKLFFVLSWGGIHRRSFLDQEVLLRRYSQMQLSGSVGSLCWGDCFCVVLRLYSPMQRLGSAILDFIKDDIFILDRCSYTSNDLGEHICSLIGRYLSFLQPIRWRDFR